MKTFFAATSILLVLSASTSNVFAREVEKTEVSKTTHETAQDIDSRKILMRHVGVFLNNDLDGVVADYSDDAVLITQDGTYTGPKEIQGFFAKLIPFFPKQGTDFQLDKTVINEGVGLIVWHAKTPAVEVPLATDTFTFKRGKIHRQTFVGQIKTAS